MWWHKYFDDSVRGVTCKTKERADGTTCNWYGADGKPILQKRNATNQKHHLLSEHGVTEPTGRPQEQQQLKQGRFDVKEVQVLAFAQGYLPFSHCELSYLRLAWHMSILDADTLKRHTEQLCARLRCEKLQRCAGKVGTLLVDGGTVHQKYIVVSLAVEDESIMLRGIPVEGDELHGLTDATGLSRVVGETVKEMLQNKIAVAAVCTDNAANMLRWLGLLRLRCCDVFPRIGTIACTVAALCPTEAAVERIFSRMKRLLPANRATQLALNTYVAATVVPINVDAATTRATDTE
ncbi:MAG: hypothetical protein Q8R01_09105, partial [Ramlibacter sp.]|nr:hypothetical protein [Ramlibacter sp.]